MPPSSLRPDIYAPLSTYAMSAGDLLAIRRGGDGVIRCLQGTVLVSLQGCLTDFDLAPGMELAIDRNPLVLIESCSPARIAIDAPAKPHRGLWPLLGLLHLFGLASALASDDLPAESGRAAAACGPGAHQARIQAWRVGRGMLDADGVVATNRVLAAYERKHAMEDCPP